MKKHNENMNIKSSTLNNIMNRILLSGVLLIAFFMVEAGDKKQNADWVAPLKDRRKQTVYSGEDLKYIAMPVGGIVAGQLYFNGDGSLGRWDIMNVRSFGNSPVLRRFPDRERMLRQGFALRVQDGNKIRNLPLDLKTFPKTTFTPEFPAGIVRYAGADDLTMDVTLEGIAPFVPLDTKASGIPATFLRVTIKNTGTTELRGDLLGWLENGVAAHSGSPGEGVRTASVRSIPGALSVEFSAKSSNQSEMKQSRQSVILADFETTDYMGWKSSGSFGTRPTLFSELIDMPQDAAGAACAGSVRGGPEATGILESPEFRIERDILRMITARGRDEKNILVELHVDGKVVRSSTGSGATGFRLLEWDVRDFNGKTGRLMITDNSKKDYILIDQVELSDANLGPLEKRPDFGGMALMLMGPASGATADPSVTGNVATGFQKGSAEVPFGESQIGIITAPWSLKPGETHTLTFAVAWHFPNLELIEWGKLQGSGRWYASCFANLPAVTDVLAAKGLQILRLTDLWRTTWYNSTLPCWVLDRVMANASTLATHTCYRFKDGRFYGFEGVHSFIGTCNHVWHYEETVGRLFPELEMSLRKQADYVPGVGIKSDGSIPMRIDGQMGSLDPLPSQPVLFGAGYQHWASIDGQCGIILRTYRNHLTSANDSFLKEYWPRIKLATQWLFRQDTDGDNLPDAVTHHTLDEDIAGPSPWISSLWLAALSAAGNMAAIAGDEAFATECRERVAKGKQSYIDKLWRGDRFVHISPESEKWRPGSYDGVHIDQVLGQQWAWRTGLDRIVPAKETRIALETTFLHNHMADIGPYYASDPANKPARQFAVAGEAGTLMATYPEGSYRPDGKIPGHEWHSDNRFHQGFYNETMTGFEHAFASHLIYEGLVDEGLRVFRAVHDRHQPSSANPRNPFNEPEAGQHYSRAMASYAVFLALCGFDYDGPEGKISFAPRLGADDFRVAFTAAEGWGTYSQKRIGKKMTVSLDLKFGQIKIKTLGLVLPAGAKPRQIKATLGGQSVPATLQIQTGRVQVVFERPLTVTDGQMLVVNL
jgi:non-lysosomal glucosylceramidase